MSDKCPDCGAQIEERRLVWVGGPHRHPPSEFAPCPVCEEPVHNSWNGWHAHRHREVADELAAVERMQEAMR